MAALDKGLHVLTEKPMVCTVDHAHQVIAKAEETGKVLMISYQRHLQAQYTLCAQSNRGRGIGGYPVYIGTPRPEVVSGDDWAVAAANGTVGRRAGSTIRAATYWTLRCGMTGLEVAEVQAYMEYLDSEVDINSALSLRFGNGALGTIAGGGQLADQRDMGGHHHLGNQGRGLSPPRSALLQDAAQQ